MKTPILFAAALLAAAAAHAETTVQDAWIRATVPQQKASAMFGRITSSTGGKLVGASSAVAGVAEVHEMAMEGSVMKMRPVAGGLALPAGQAVTLAPKSVHVMLMDLKQQLKPGDMVPVTLVVEGADKTRETIELKVPVKPMVP